MTDKIPVFIQEPNRIETRRKVGEWPDVAVLDHETVEMSGWAPMDSIIEIKKRSKDRQPIWVIVADAPEAGQDPLPAQTDMSHLTRMAVSRGCQWLAPHKPGDDLRVWLPNGRIREYSVGDEIDIAALDRELRRVGR
jgi:hypothetical protein